MNCFLVDYENVNAAGLNGVSSLSAEDSVIIFYSEKAETMTFGLHRRLNESKASISFQKVSTGSKNALDFQLCTYLGYLIAQNGQSGQTDYYIVSEDQDYAVLPIYWKHRKVNVSLISKIFVVSATPDAGSVDEPPAPPETASANEPPATPDPAPANEIMKKPDVSIAEIQTLLKTLLPAKYQGRVPAIAEIIRNGRTKGKVHSELMRAFHQGADNSVPYEIYQSVKPLLLSGDEYVHLRLRSLLPAKYESRIPAIVEIIIRCKTKQAVNGELIRAFHQGADSSEATEIYRCVKPILTDKA